MKVKTRLVLFALAVVVSSCGAAQGAATDPIHDYPTFTDPNADYYYTFGDYTTSPDFGYNYQLRDVSGANDGHTIAGGQWFATVYENYLWRYINEDPGTRLLYRRTLGGGAPDAAMTASADLLYDFNHVYIDEPEPYPAWPDTRYRDSYMDPIESAALVFPNGRGEFRVSLANHYARHFPYWWDTNNNPVNPNSYTVVVYTLSADVSGDTVMNVSGDVVCRVDDAEGRIYDPSAANVLYTLSGGTIRNASGDVVYNLTQSGGVTCVNSPAQGLVYVVSGTRVLGSTFGRDVMEDVRLAADGYSVSVNPNGPQRVAPGASMTARLTVTAEDPGSYGSTLGYISFRQSASFDTGYTGWRESIQIPVVLANVYDGPASEPGSELYFDMMLFDRTLSGDVVTNEDIVNRIKFRWGAAEDMTQDLGVLYMMGSVPTYHLETRITNRTGTRYRVQRYDMITDQPLSTDSRPDSGRSAFRDVRPDHWRYDLTPDLYGTLPDHFQLDAHSQVAPGLVTVYKNNVGSGYGAVNTTYGTSESFRLYPFSGTTPHDLRLSYRRIGGMTGVGDTSAPNNRWRVRSFRWDQFADVVRNDEQTDLELQLLMGLPAAMGSSVVSPTDTYINSSALNAFEINTPVPAGLVSADRIIDGRRIETILSGDVSVDVEVVLSHDVPAEIAVQPMQIRFRIPRQEQMLVNRWADLDAAADNTALLRQFMRFGTIWLRSPTADDQDTNLFTALSNRGVDPTECVRAFIYDDELYLDFIVLVADAKSPRTGYTAYLQTFRDDGVPYILIGDGAADGIWNLKFYVGGGGANPESGYSSDDVRPAEGDDGGGGCSSAAFGLIGLALAAPLLFLRRKGL